MKCVRLLLVLLAAAPLLAAPLSAQTSRLSWQQRFRALARQEGLNDTDRLHRLFALDWEFTMRENPEWATDVGYPGQNDRWSDRSLAAINRRRAAVRAESLVVARVRRARLNSADRLSYDIFRRNLYETLEGYRYPSDLIQITALNGVQYLSDVIGRMPAQKVEHYRDIVARLERVPTVLAQTIALLDSGLALGVTPPAITLRDVPAQVLNLVPSDPLKSPLLLPLTKFPASMSADDRQRLTDRAVQTYTFLVRPAYQRFLEYMTNTYVPRARQTLGMSAMPNGQAWYAFNVKLQTTTRRTPREIHDLGLAEVKRIRAQMDSVIASTGFSGDFAAFIQMLRTDPRFYHTDSASLVRAYRDIAKRIDPQLTKLFGRIPRLPYGVTTIPQYAAPSQTTAYYEQGSPDAHRPGQYFVNTYKLDTRPIYEMEALSIHEAVPGHHFQIALAQELDELPDFRQQGGYTAFVEGWALYSESLGPDMGFYQDPYSKFGQLTYEMWRAIRLVLDTGIHAFDWTRDQAIDYFKANSAKTENDIVVEVDRYISWPGQALAYKSGELAIKALRRHAEQELGARFDIRAFHDQVLGQGALPLDVLDFRIRRWVAAQRPRP